MKIVAVDNFDNEAVADVLVAENITNESYAEVMAKALNDKYSASDHAARYYEVKEDNYRLRRGMEDLV
jgi:glycine/serine hydroxymethyltransferase